MWRDVNLWIYVIFNLTKLKVLDGLFIETTEIQKANEEFSGRFTDEILESRAPNMNFALMKELDISSWKLRDFDERKFSNLRELNLSNIWLH